MIRLVDPLKPIKWVHPDERDKDGKPLSGAMVWGLLPLTEKKSRTLYADIDLGTLSRGGVAAGDVADVMLGLFADHVAFINNALMPGQEKRQDLTTRAELDRFLECIPPGYMDKAYIAIQNLSALDGGMVGN